MERRERVEKLIKLLSAVQLYLDEGRELLHGAIGEMDAARDFAILQRSRFELIEGGEAEEENEQ